MHKDFLLESFPLPSAGLRGWKLFIKVAAGEGALRLKEKFIFIYHCYDFNFFILSSLPLFHLHRVSPEREQ